MKTHGFAKALWIRQERLASRGELGSGFPDGLPWAETSLDSVPLLDPSWNGKRVAEIVHLLVRELVQLHQQQSRDAATARSSAAEAAIATIAASGVAPMVVEKVGQALKAESRHAVSGNHVAAWASVALQGSKQTLECCSSFLAIGEECAERREGGSSFGGLVVIRPEMWGAQVTRKLIQSLWAAHKKDNEGEGRLDVLLRSHFARQHGNEHCGLICADVLNFEAACWRLRDTEPQALGT